MSIKKSANELIFIRDAKTNNIIKVEKKIFLKKINSIWRLKKL